MGRCYLRFRGEVTGPFHPDEVRRLYARELLTPAHEVSTDRRHWTPLRPSDLPADDEAANETDDEAPADLDGLLAPTATTTPLAPAPSAASSPLLPRVVMLSCGTLIAFTALLPVGLDDDAGVAFPWGSGARVAASSLLTLLVASGVAAVGAMPRRGLPPSLPIAGGCVGLALLPLTAPGGLAMAIGWWQCAAGAVAAVAFAATHRRQRQRRHALIVAGAVLIIAAAVSVAAASLSHAFDGDPSGRFTVLHALRLSFVAAAWAGVVGVGASMRRSPPAFTLKDST